MSNENKNSHSGEGHDDDIKVEIATPNGLYRGEFDKNDKIEEVIAAIVEDRQLAEGDAFELWYGETHLQPGGRTLVSFGLCGKVRLSLVATGSGV